MDLVKILKQTVPIIGGAIAAGGIRILDLPTEYLAILPIIQISQRFTPYYGKLPEELKQDFKSELFTFIKYSFGVGLIYSDKIINYL